MLRTIHLREADIIRLPHIHSDLFTKDGDILCISPKNITGRNELLLSNSDFVSSENLNEHDLLQKDDIIMITTGSLERIGNYYRYNLPMKAVVRGDMFVIRPIMSADELVVILDRKYFNIKLLATEFGNNNRPHLTMFKLRRSDLENLQI